MGTSTPEAPTTRVVLPATESVTNPMKVRVEFDDFERESLDTNHVAFVPMRLANGQTPAVDDGLAFKIFPDTSDTMCIVAVYNPAFGDVEARLASQGRRTEYSQQRYMTHGSDPKMLEFFPHQAA